MEEWDYTVIPKTYKRQIWIQKIKPTDTFFYLNIFHFIQIMHSRKPEEQHIIKLFIFLFFSYTVILLIFYHLPYQSSRERVQVQEGGGRSEEEETLQVRLRSLPSLIKPVFLFFTFPFNRFWAHTASNLCYLGTGWRRSQRLKRQDSEKSSFYPGKFPWPSTVTNFLHISKIYLVLDKNV